MDVSLPRNPENKIEKWDTWKLYNSKSHLESGCETLFRIFWVVTMVSAWDFTFPAVH